MKRYININNDGDYEENNLDHDVSSIINEISVTAGSNIGGGRVVLIYNNIAEYADNINNYIGQVGISVNAANIGDIIVIRVSGFITDSSWNFIKGPIYLGSNGVMTQSEPAIGASVQIGWAKSPTSFLIKPNIPIER